MRKLLLLIIMIGLTSNSLAQSYDSQLNSLGNYVERMYINEPFQGVKIISDLDVCYLISVVVESKPSNGNAMQRKAEIKGLRYANEFLNGSQISSHFISYTKETSSSYSHEEIVDYIESRSMGYVQQMHLLTKFLNANGENVFVFCKQLSMPVSFNK